MAGAARTVREAVTGSPAPPFADCTAPVVFVTEPGAEPVTSTEKLQLAPMGIVPPTRLTLCEPGPAVIVPAPQLPLTPFGDATTRPAGNVFSSATPVSATVFAGGLAIVKVSAVDSPTPISSAPKAADRVGGATTANAPAGSLQPVALAACRASPLYRATHLYAPGAPAVKPPLG